MKNSFLNHLQAERTDYAQTVERSTRQYDMDTLQIALHRSRLRLGYDRIMEITDLWCSVMEEYRDARTDNPEADVLRAHMDDELRGIMAGRPGFVPFEKRNPELKEIKYEGRKRK